MDARNPDAAQPVVKKWRLAPWLFGLVLLAALIAVVVRLGELQRFVQLARRAEPQWLLLALVLQAGTYLCTAAVWKRTLASAGRPVSLASLTPLGLAKLFTDQALPSGGLSGTLLLVHGFARRGIPGPLAAETLLITLLSFFSAYLLATLAALVILWLHREASAALIATAGVFALLAVGGPAALLWMRRFGRAPAWTSRLPAFGELLARIAAAPATLLHDRRLLAATIVLQLQVFVLDAATLWVVFLALAEPVSPLTAYVSFMAGSVAATIGPIPLGLGTFEGAAVTMLHVLGVDVEAALAATLLLRGLTFWLPMIPGLWLARREIARSGARR